MVTPVVPEHPLTEVIQLPVSEWKHKLVNDFEKPVFAAFPRIGEIKRKLYDSGAVYASMSGSGSAVYGLFTEIPEPGDHFQGSYIWSSGRL
jgi:4-diphosphocytidyl-2-C-methyl-D-erythritol kinase